MNGCIFSTFCQLLDIISALNGSSSKPFILPWVSMCKSLSKQWPWGFLWFWVLSVPSWQQWEELLDSSLKKNCVLALVCLLSVSFLQCPHRMCASLDKMGNLLCFSNRFLRILLQAQLPVKQPRGPGGGVGPPYYKCSFKEQSWCKT